MSTKYLVGKGHTFSISTDGGTTYTAVKQLKTVNYGDQKSDYDDLTNLDSPGNTREFAPTLIDPGTTALQGVFDPADAGQLAVKAGFLSQALLTFKHQFPKASDQTVAGDVRTFTAYVMSTSKDLQFDKASTFGATLKVTGPYNDTAGS